LIAVLDPVPATWTENFETSEFGKVIACGSNGPDSLFAHEGGCMNVEEEIC
jgi:hypothetical protein